MRIAAAGADAARAFSHGNVPCKEGSRKKEKGRPDRLLQPTQPAPETRSVQSALQLACKPEVHKQSARERIQREYLSAARHHGLNALMSPELLLPQSCAVCWPTDVMAVRHAMITKASMTAYSTAVAASSSVRNLSSFVMVCFNVSESDVVVESVESKINRTPRTTSHRLRYLSSDLSQTHCLPRIPEGVLSPPPSFTSRIPKV